MEMAYSFTRDRKHRGSIDYSLSQSNTGLSNTGLCNIPSNNSPIFKNENGNGNDNGNKKKSKRNKSKSKSKRHSRKQQPQNISNNNSIVDDKTRSKSRPRLSNSDSIKINDNSRMKKRKSELITINREKLIKKRSSIDSVHIKPKKEKKRKNLHNIKENKESKPSSKKKLFGKRLFKTKVPSLQTKNLDNKHRKHKRKSMSDNQNIPSYTKSAKSVDVLNKFKAASPTSISPTSISLKSPTKINTSNYPQSASSKRKLFKMKSSQKRPRTKSTPKQYTSLKSNMYEEWLPDKDMTRRPSARLNKDNKKNKNKQRGRARHKYAGSHGIHLSMANQAIKQRSASVKRPSLGNTLTNTKRKSFTNDSKPRSCTNKEVKQRLIHNNNNNNNKNKKRNKRKGRGIKQFTKNQQPTITGKYNTFNKYYHSPKELSPSPSPMAPPLHLVFEDEKSEIRDDPSYLSVSSVCSSTSYATDSDIEFLGFSPILKNKPNFDKPKVKIVYSPRINEAVFVGYTPAPRPTYKFRGKGKMNDLDLIPEPSPSPDAAKFTFINIKSKYLPHRIKWTSKTGYTDTENDTEDDVYADNPPLFTFSDQDDTDDDDDHDVDDDDVDDDDHDPSNPHKSEKTMKINELLSNLLGSDTSDSDSEDLIIPKPASSKLLSKPTLSIPSCQDDKDNDDGTNNTKKVRSKSYSKIPKSKSKSRPKSKPKKKQKKFKIVIDEIKHDENGDEIYIGEVTDNDEDTPPSHNNNDNNNNDKTKTKKKKKRNGMKLEFSDHLSGDDEGSDDGDGELLFDFSSFVNGLKARSQTID